MAPLARLPVFLDLAGKTVVLAGDGEAAAWKAELLLAAGAHVRVFAPSPCPALAAFLAGAGPACTHLPRAWQPADLTDAALAVADAADDDTAAAFAQAARTAGVPANVIDRPAFGTVQFGAIVNRSPVVIGISTAGAAPVLGQAIRARIETLLPAALAGWARLAQTLRPRLAALLPDPARRRAFWARFAAHAFRAAPPEAIDDATLRRLAEAAPAEGHVTLVGAGPGDAELLTLKAMRALQAADVILYDDLVSAEVLDLARREAKRMMVGKRGGRASCRQGDINALMIRLARQGRRVVRLKSGDPMIFGRAGEEIAELHEAGIAVSVVPGISAAQAMAAELGISLTRRGQAQSVRFVTGHGSGGDLPPELDWRGLADPAATLVVYMPGRTARAFAARLIAAGLSPATPARLAIAVSRPGARFWQGDLATLAAGAMPETDGEPALLGIGAVFAATNADIAAPAAAAAAVA
jgi:uroporphyrin-III C-methyltransferase/precorrin-2 dehydrogenase/sirohydrochlorin ferrochelatase